MALLVCFYQQDAFMRMLEDVRALYDKFLQDRRHTGLHVVLAGHAEKRIFDDCSMGFANMDRAGEYPEYDDYVDNQLALDASKGACMTSRSY